MCRNEEPLGLAGPVDYPGGPVAIVMAPSTHDLCVMQVEGALCMPLRGELRRRVRALLGRGERSIVLDLARVSRIDAAGVGELVRADNMTRAVNGTLRIAHPTARVREMLDRAGLLDILSADPESDHEIEKMEVWSSR